MKAKPNKSKSLTDWDWTTVVAAWRYYEHRHTIESAMFPHELVRRYWSSDYSDDDRMRIARQFVDVDHYRGPDENLYGWRPSDHFGECDCRAWRLFYWFLYAYCHHATSVLHIVNGKTEGDIECFKADGKWYAVKGYVRHGAYVAPYEAKHIKEGGES